MVDAIVLEHFLVMPFFVVLKRSLEGMRGKAQRVLVYLSVIGNFSRVLGTALTGPAAFSIGCALEEDILAFGNGGIDHS